MARLYKHDDMIELAKNATIPVINGLTDYNHPCQIMADFLTISEILGRTENFKFVYVGDGNNMAHSFLRMAAMFPIELTIACPKGYEPDEATFRMANKANENVKIVYDPILAVKGADIIYTDVWASMGQKEEAEKRFKDFSGF